MVLFLFEFCFSFHGMLLLDSLGSRRGVVGVDVDFGHRMRWLPHRSGVPLRGVYCPFVGLG